ncbi:MAG: VCBS repeat-containing protein [Candidatus Bipolaricaulota bacterium]|nr:VCBS repeat-containing protein [Candidatus Bipolaricaulota bacterium]MDW8151732.1 VCBS repeat-containing protein [Candidatus Bipolaricaulota bacterium]
MASVLLVLPFLVASLFYLRDVFSGVWPPYPGDRREDPQLGKPWPMWPVDNPGDWLPNGLDLADVNGDGYPDLLVNYEFRGRIRVVLHPGPNLSRWAYWPAVDAGRFPNAENAAFGDLDGDGHVDIVVAHGLEWTWEEPGISVLWGEGGLRWARGGTLPESRGGWHFLEVQVADLDGDGFPDIVAGGRANRPAGGPKDPQALRGLRYAGLRAFRNPKGRGGNPRDLAQWTSFPIDPAVPSGHGFVLCDFDGDGFLDLALNNADWDTPEEEEAILVYRNPGRSGGEGWPRFVLYRSPEFYGKEQVAAGDLDGDGRPDLAAQAELEVHLFYNRTPPGGPLRFAHVRVGKPPSLRWRARPIALADLNGDERLDLVGASIHRDGLLPKEVAAVWGLAQTAEGWVPHVIKWGSGFLGLGPFNGEKWDRLIPLDVDGDGDLDLVGNVEEFNRLESYLAVVWWENPRLAR